MHREDLANWSGNIEEFVGKAAETARRVGLQEKDGPNIRLVRDYLHRGILGQTRKAGKEIEFGYANLVRYLAARVLLDDGWPLKRIAQHFDVSTEHEIEALVPGLTNKAVAALQSIKRETAAASGFAEPGASFSQRAAKISGIQAEMRDAIARLGLTPKGLPTEQVTLAVLATWCQVLVQTDRLDRITIEEAEEVGRLLTVWLLDNVTKGSGKK